MARLPGGNAGVVLSKDIADIQPRQVEHTREAVRRRVAGSPGGEVLVPFFDRGKMVRARLVFAAAAAMGADSANVRAGAEAIELLHGASLIHDDIMDQADERRALTAVHRRVGVDQAIVLGDELLFMAYAALCDDTRDPACTVAATAALTRCAMDCCRGQLAELQASRGVSEEDYIAIVRGKTAAQFVAAVTLGGLLGRADPSALEKVQTCAEHTGIAFQMSDDLLDLFGDGDALGKPVGNSLTLGRPLLPLIYLREDARREPCDPSRARDELVETLNERGILERVRARQRHHAECAVAALDGFGAAAESLRALVTCAAATVESQVLP